MKPEHEAAAQGAFVIGTVALQELREKDETISRLMATVEHLEREADQMAARIEELSPSMEQEAA